MRRWLLDNGGYVGYDVEQLEDDEGRPFIKATPVYEETDPRLEEALRGRRWWPLIRLHCRRVRADGRRCTRTVGEVWSTKVGDVWTAYRLEPGPFEKQSAQLTGGRRKVANTRASCGTSSTKRRST